MILNTPLKLKHIGYICTKFVIKVYLILSDVDDNATPEVFHDGVDVIGLRTAKEDPLEEIRLRRSAIEDLSEEIQLRRFVGGDPTEKICRRISD